MNRCTAFSCLLVAASTLSAAPIKHEVFVHFGKDDFTLNDEAITVLEQFLSSIKLEGDFRFSVEGHTDSDGSYAYNDTLAAERARTVRDFLVGRGIAANLVQLRSRGKRSPMASNSIPSGMAENRRVQVVFTRFQYGQLDELLDALQEERVQRFIIDPAKDNTIRGLAGATVSLPANAFTTPTGQPVKGSVSIELAEALDAMGMVSFGLSTRSGDRLLETDGMVQVAALDATGKPLQLKSSSPMTVTMPANEVKPRMELFLSSTGTDWTVARAASNVTSIADRGIAQPIGLRVVRDLPEYKEDQRGKPIKPSIPVMPKAPPPIPPPSIERPWWGFLRPGMLHARERGAEARFNERKQKVEQRYQDRLERYRADKADFPNALARYAVKKAAWDSLKQVEYTAWRKEVYEPAVARFDAVQRSLDAPYDQALSMWKAQRDSARQAWADTVRTVTSESLSNYVYTTSWLGWINCDRFYDVPEDRKAPVMARTAPGIQAHAYVVFTGRRMLLKMEQDDAGRYVSQPVPTTEPAVIFAISVKDGQAQLCVEPVVKNKTPELEFKPSTVAELDRRLAELAGN